VLGFEVQPDLAAETWSVREDFLKTNPTDWPAVDAVVMNPPFSRSQDIHHVQQAWRFLKPGGKLAAVVGPMALRGHTAAHERFAAWLSSVGGTVEELPAGTFSESGTQVSSLLLVATKR
jgi:16S rRNA G1207 methylase RsmC